MKFLALTILLWPNVSFATPFEGTPEEILAHIEKGVANNNRSKTFVTQLSDTLRDPEATVPVKERAAWALGQLEAKSQTPALIEAANNKGLLIRSAALNSLVRLKSKEALPVFVEIAHNDPILSMRQRATLALGLLKSDKAIQPVVKLSLDEKVEVRGAAALAMALLHSKKQNFSQALQEMTSDESTYVVERAKIGLEIIGGKSQALLSRLNSDDANVRLYTAVYFRSYGSESHLKALKAAAQRETERDVRQELTRASAAIKKRAADPAQAQKEKEQAGATVTK